MNRRVFTLGCRTHEVDALLRNAEVVNHDRADKSFRPVFLTNAPDGSVYVADFYEHYIAHGQHYQSQIDPSTGANGPIVVDFQAGTRGGVDGITGFARDSTTGIVEEILGRQP